MASSALDGFGAGPSFLAHLFTPEDIYVIPDVEGVTMWCGWCCTQLLDGPTRASLSLLMHYAEDHRSNLCTNPAGPNVDTWAPPRKQLMVRPRESTWAGELEIRARTVEQFTAALLTGLDELERDQHRRIGPGDVADLVARVALEVGR